MHSRQFDNSFYPGLNAAIEIAEESGATVLTFSNEREVHIYLNETDPQPLVHSFEEFVDLYLPDLQLEDEQRFYGNNE